MLSITCMPFKCTFDAPYPWTPHFWMCPLTEIYFNPQIHPSRAFVVTVGVSSGKSESPDQHFASCRWARRGSSCFFQLPNCKSFSQSIVTYFSVSLCFFCHSHCPRGCSAVQCTRELEGWAGFTEKIHVLDALHAGVRYSTARGEFSVNESTICTKQGIFKHEHTEGGMLIQWWKWGQNMARALKKPNPAFATGSNGSIFTNSMSVATW